MIARRLPALKRPPVDRDRVAAELWNRQHPCGTMVRYWKAGRRGSQVFKSWTASIAFVDSGEAVVWLRGEPRPIPLKNVTADPREAA